MIRNLPINCLGAPGAVQTRRDFLANRRHELRSQLNAILGYSELWLEDTQALGHREFMPGLEKIRASGQHLLTIINGLLDPAKLAADQSKPESATPPLESFGGAAHSPAKPLAHYTHTNNRGSRY